MKTGIQVSSFKPVLTTKEEVKTAFEKIQAMGCRWVQLQWIDPSIPTEYIAEMMTKTCNKSVGVQDFFEIIRQNKAYYMDLNGKTGGKWMCVSRIPERLKTRQGLDRYVQELREFQKELDPLGQRLCFHPVSGDFAPIDGMDPVEYLLEAMSELAICADLYHIDRATGDTPAWLRRYAGRVCMVHFKDARDGVLVPPGQGDMDFSGIIPACLETGVEYGFVEQEKWEGDPFQRIQEGLDWLNGQLSANIGAGSTS